MRARDPISAKFREIKSRKIVEASVELTYWMGSDPSEMQPWVYESVGSTVRNSEEAVIEDLRVYFKCTSRMSRRSLSQ